MHVPFTMIFQVAGEPLLPYNNGGLQSLLLSALLMPHVLGLSASDASAGKRMALAAKACICYSYSSLTVPAQCLAHTLRVCKHAVYTLKIRP